MIEEVYEKTKMAIKEFKNNPVHNLAILLPVFMSWSIDQLCTYSIIFLGFAKYSSAAGQRGIYSVNHCWHSSVGRAQI